ncbi:MAG TPA: carbamoyltransferase N-terminal domain-containing protein [Bryobacteraceae bacterium]|nr:carbamoyltransferase N-terminal domain-containing protein [Bryobacteraceae bacterium]
MYVLGISCYFHDAAAALLADGRLIAAAEEERFSRRKHDFSFPDHAIEFCLTTAGIRAADVDYVVFFEKPFVKWERLLVSCLEAFPHSRRVFQEAMVSWLADKLWIKHLIQQRLGVPAARILFSEHHLSHAASAFLCSPFEDAAILTVDGVGEWATAAIGVGRGTDVRLLEEIQYPHSLGLLYSAFTAFLGFEVNEGEYKVMGLAPYGEPRYVDEVNRLIRIAPDGSFELDLTHFSFHYSTERTFSPRFERVFGPARDPSRPFSLCDPEARRYADVAASVQRVTEDVLLGMARRAAEVTGLPRLCMAGGVALNSVANGRILRESPFREIYIQPAAGDSGAALGAALWGWNTVLGNPRGFVMEHAAWGQEHSPDAVRKVLDSAGVPYGPCDDDAVAEALAGGGIVGWVDGRFEWGPRALGHRSILADPRQAGMKDRINAAVKYREPFRPFAPAVIPEAAESWFDLPGAARQWPARFMLYVAPVAEARRGEIPAVTHVDGTARVQVVHPATHPRFHRLIESFGRITGTPVLLNTSFNVKGEPIVNTPAEALETWRRTGIDLLVLGDFMVRKACK